MFTGTGLDDKSKDELIVHTSNMSGVAEMPGEDLTTSAKSETKEVEAMDPPRDPPSTATTTSSTINEPIDYFTTHPTYTNDEQHHTSHYLPLLPPPRSEPSVAGSDALAPGTIVTPSISPNLERPAPQREPSTGTILSMRSIDSNDTVTQDQIDSAPSLNALSASGTLPSRPAYPNQAYAALHSQFHPVRRTSPILRQSSSHPSHILTFAQGLHQSGSRTAGNSPAATPSAGLYSPKVVDIREGWSSPQTPGTYASPYLHPTHRQAPKETHVADVDVDPISGRKLINHYEIVDELGRGTHGKVKLGRDLETTDTFVAIKIVERYSKRRRLGRLGNPEDKVKKEVAILKKARHPNIVALLEVIDDPTRKKVYIVLEWMERGTIHWRGKTVKEIAFLEAHRYERERSGVQTGASQAEDNAIQREVAHRLYRQKQDEYKKFRRARRDRDPTRGIDHYGGGEDSDDDTLSRISTTTNDSSLRSRQEEAPIADGVATPTVERPQIDLDPDALKSREDLRAWASRIIDEELNPELQYVPVMTLQNIQVAFRDTLLGLLYLHYQGIIHRDIKPPNLLQTTDHRVKISDFGVSYLGRPVHEGEPGEEVSESEVRDLDGSAKELAKTVGTPAFYAPELCITDLQDDTLPVTKAIDVWALGITLFCMIFARTPFVDSEFVVMRQIADEEIYIPRRRLAPVGDKSRSRPSSRNRAYSPQTADRRQEYDIVYEEIDDELYDLLKRLLIKDPRQRATLEEIRLHPWLLADLPYHDKWIEETDTYCQSQGKKIEVSKEDVNAAVVPLQWVERMRSGIKKIGDRLLGSSARGRSTSSVNSGSAPNSQPPSAHSSSSTISQDVRRHSLRSEEIFTVLKAHRDAEHPLAKSLAASPREESLNRAYFRDMPPHLGPFDDYGAALAHTMSHDSATRPALAGRSKTEYSATGSIKTITQSDAHTGSPPSSPGLPSTPRPLEAGGNNLGALLGGSHRSAFKAAREASSTRSGQRDASTDRGSISSKDAHSGPSIAISDAQASGRVLHAIDTAQSSASNSEQNSPVSVRPPGYRSVLGGLSRQSSTASAGSSKARLRILESAPHVQPQYQPESSEEDWLRGREQYMRRRLQEASQPPRPASAFEERECPPSPDDVRSRQVSDASHISRIDISRPLSSYETSPTAPSIAVLPSLVSSSSDFGSAVSMSVSNPSIPSVISEASSVDSTDGQPLEAIDSKYIVSSWDTITSPARAKDELLDEGYNPDEDIALDSDRSDSDSDSDSDGGLVMSRRKSATKIALSSSPRNIGLAIDAGHKQRRGTGLSRSSKKSSRSGSNNTMKRMRTRDSIEERRRTSLEYSESK